MFKLCAPDSSAGVVLRHAIRTLENLLRQEYPLIFKIGFSHNPIWRWQNQMYGYSYAKEKWSHMWILHYTHEPYTCAMLEAALIEKFGSASAELTGKTKGRCFFVFNCDPFIVFGAPCFFRNHVPIRYERMLQLKVRRRHCQARAGYKHQPVHYICCVQVFSGASSNPSSSRWS